MNNKIIYSIAIILSLGAFFVMPVYDDFYYLTAPHKFLPYNDLLPNGPFWRPIDAIIGFIIGKYSLPFPFLNHLIVLITFAFAIYGLKKILAYCHISPIAQSIALAFFCLSPALVATTYSIDSSNQTMSLALGLASLLVYQRRKFLAYILMILALFCKESGIAWFVITPILNLLIQKYHKDDITFHKQDFKPITKAWCLSFLILAIYATARIYLNIPGEAGTEPSTRYSGGIGINSITGLMIILSLSTTVIDTIALFIEKNYIILAISCIASLMFIYTIGKKIKHQPKTVLYILAIVVLAAASPHLVMKHPSEMHLYPVLWLIALSIGLSISNVKWSKKENLALYAYFIMGVFVFAHKGIYIYKNGKIAESRTKSAVAQTAKIPKSVIVLDCDEQAKAYSVFQIDGKKGWDSGKGTRIYFDLINPQEVDYHVIKSEQVNTYIKSYYKSRNKYDACWIVKDNKVKVIH